MRRIVLSLLAFVVGCGDPLGLEATQPVLTDSLTLYAFSIAPPTYPSAISTPFAQPVPATSAGNFDVALDVTADGRIMVMPVAAVVRPLAGAHSVGLLQAGASYEAVESAPVTTYTRDTVMIVGLNEVVVIEANRARPGDICSFALSPFIYSKLMVVEVDPESRRMTVRFTVDPNCGFRSFAEGIPRD